jgi:hypothetical protein
MNRAALEHLLRAAAAVTGESTFYVIGSAAILPSLPDDGTVPDVVLRSREADLIPSSGSARTIDLIDGALGQDSTFDGTFGYYADGVDFSTTSYAPAGWRERTIRFSNAATGEAVGLCMEAHDLVISKLCAGRDKDLEFTRSLITAGVVEVPCLLERLEMVTAPAGVVRLALERLTAYARDTRRTIA